MNIDSLLPFLIVIVVLLLAFLLEAAVMYFFKLKTFWKAFGISVPLNLISFALLYFFARPILSSLGYEIGQANGLNLAPQVILFLWWFSVVVEGSLLSLLLRRQNNRLVFLSVIFMNLASFVFLYVFDIISH